ncbi:STAS domain-containing protein [Streptomyces sp. cmx-4-9]|uniref:STAS domain-containing protein n=1 Tax=Streptomyces sp. cmx-4-9 TaxID=2790941 RepID=UPI003980B2E5
MTILPPGVLQMAYTETGSALHLELSGDLDHESAHQLLDLVTDVLHRNPGPDELRVDCAALAGIDSVGLSTLLMVRRLTGACGTRLHLDRRPLRLERLLALTGTLGYLTDTGAEHAGSAAPESRQTRSQQPDHRT